MTPRTVAVAATTVVAVVAAIVSYDHMRMLAERAGEGWKAVLVPLAVDGLVVAASTVLIARRRANKPGGVLAWLALVGGVLMSLAANAAAAQPTLIGRAVTIIPPLAQALSFELVRALISVGHQAAPEDAGESDEAHPVPQGDLVDRAARLAAAGQRAGRLVGRTLLARELGITEHQVRQLREQITAKSTTGLQAVGEAEWA